MMVTNVICMILIYLCFKIGVSRYSSDDLNRFSNTMSGEGEVIISTNNEYETLRQQYDPSLSRFPSVIIKCNNIFDVQKSVQFALDFDEQFVVRSGGHSTQGYSNCDGCIMIDLKDLNDIRIKEKPRKNSNSFDASVIVNPGVLLNELSYHLEFNSNSGTKYWVPTGLDNVGIGGHIHGGGWGFGIRKYGMTTDNLMQAKVIVIETKGRKKFAKIEIANKFENEELFYCIRGVIGPSCGIVVEYELQIYEQNLNGYSIGKISVIAESMDFYENIDKLTTINASISDQKTHGLLTFHFKYPNTDYIVTTIIYSFYDGNVILNSYEYENEIINTVTKLGGYIVSNSLDFGGYTFMRCIVQGYNSTECKRDDILQTFNIIDKSTVTPTHQSAHWLYNNKNEWQLFVDNSGYKILLNGILTNCPQHSICGWYVSTWGGKVNEIASDAIGFAHRDTKFDIVLLDYFYNVNDFQMNREWMRHLFIDNFYNNGLTTKRGYPNYSVFGLSKADSFAFYYGNNQNKLIHSKCLWDPQNIFTHPQDIPTNTCH